MNSDVVNSIAEYICNNDINDMTDIDIYNCWAEKNNIVIHEPKNAIWIKNFIHSIKTVEPDYIKESLNLNRKDHVK